MTVPRLLQFYLERQQPLTAAFPYTVFRIGYLKAIPCNCGLFVDDGASQNSKLFLVSNENRQSDERKIKWALVLRQCKSRG